MRTSHLLAAAKRHRGAVTVALVALSVPLASVGRWLLDQLIAEAPASTGLIERVGGWLLGTVIAVIVLLPLFYIWDVLKPK
jgi:hypothetical protein